MKKNALWLHVSESIFAGVAILWFVLPQLMADAWFNPLTIAGSFGGFDQAFAATLILILVVLVLAVAAWKLLAWFLDKALPALCDPDRPLPILFNVLASFALIFIHLVHAFTNAATAAYFTAIPLSWYLGAGLVVLWNAFSLIRLIKYASTVNPAYTEYLEYRKQVEQDASLSARVKHTGIQRRLVLSFTIIILVIIAILSYILLKDFGDTLLNSVKENGLSLAERSATVVSAAIGDRIDVQDYLDKEARKNAASAIPFDNISYLTRDKGAETTVIRASTRTGLVETSVANDAYVLEKTTMLGPDQAGIITFLSPASFSGKYLGYVKVEYQDSIIMAPLYRTQIKVLLIGILFVYFAIFIVYLFGHNIVIPILFLRMSVNAISDILGSMIHGGRKISPAALEYKDRVATKDEIKGLSMEIGSMTGVIRGLLPYISNSTLKAADRDKPSSEKKDLCFIFTDIRGFTTLCEGHKPEEIVEMLNHYLEIQSSIILDNYGDIDKFVGDEIMGTFEGPDKELNACRASIAIRQAMAQEKEIALLAKKNVVSIGIGINTGEVIFGSVGAKDRMDFTSIGDTVNLAARLEGANKTYGTKTLITEAVYNLVKDEFICREIDLLTVKGKNIPVRIYEILQTANKVTPKIRKIKDDFEAALQLYRQQEWAKAIPLLQGLVQEVGDETSDIFLKRIELFRNNPPAKDWDGVFNLSVK